MMTSHQGDKRFAQDSGIAIGPILFIIAILAILAAAIAAGSGSFTAGTQTESDSTKAYALIQEGETLKVGMDRITMEGGIAPTAVIISPANTSNLNELFSPIGGGVLAPSATMANNSANDSWNYIQGAIPGLGTTAAEVFAVLHVSQGVCSAINNKSLGYYFAPSGADLGNFNAATVPSMSAVWPITAGTTYTGLTTGMKGVMVGCVNNTNTTTTGYYFYQVLAIQ